MGSGGGGSTVTQTSGIDPEFKPYLERVLRDVTGRYEQDVAQGPTAVVADLTQAQKDALQLQKNLAGQAISGTGMYDVAAAQKADLMNVLGSGMGQASSANTLGSARSQAAINKAVADQSLANLKDRQRTTLAGVDLLGKAGTTEQQFAQQLLDAPHTSASRYFGYLGNAPQQTTKQSSGGGK
mgnify:FL=1